MPDENAPVEPVPTPVVTLEQLEKDRDEAIKKAKNGDEVAAAHAAFKAAKEEL